MNTKVVMFALFGGQTDQTLANNFCTNPIVILNITLQGDEF